jgi:hypothetical protein
MKIAFALLMLAGAATAAVAQGGGPPLDVTSLARGAGKVVVGRVVDVQPRFETNRFGDQLIVSHATVEVIETLKGPAQQSVRVAVEGGTVGGLTLEVSDMPTLVEGDEALLFLDSPAQGDDVPHDRGRGIVMFDPRGRVRGSATTLDALRDQVRAAVAQGRGGR